MRKDEEEDGGERKEQLGGLLQAKTRYLIGWRDCGVLWLGESRI